jgi:hypothetical protein
MSTATPTKEDSSSKVVKNHPLICLKRHFFFRGLVTGFLDVHNLEAQEHEWNLMTADERLESIRHEGELRKLVAESSELVTQGNAVIASSQRSKRDRLRRERRLKRQARWNFVKSKLGAFHLATINLRYKIAGRWLLLPAEEEKRVEEKVLRKAAFDRLEQELRYNLEDVRERIDNGKLKPAKVEGSDIDLYRDGALCYFFVREILNDAAAQRFLAAFERYRDPNTHRLNKFHGFMEHKFERTVEGMDRLSAEGITLSEV